jgi:hypothetical protein
MAQATSEFPRHLISGAHVFLLVVDGADQFASGFAKTLDKFSSVVGGPSGAAREDRNEANHTDSPHEEAKYPTAMRCADSPETSPPVL